MTGIIIRKSEGCDPDFVSLWDSVWDVERGLADWQLSDGTEPQNHGGLRAKNALGSAVILALFTDKRVEESHPLFYLSDGDPRGYWGDVVDVRDDLGEGELGSLLWLLERAPVNIRGRTADVWAKEFARTALEPLQTQGLVTRIEISATLNAARGRIELLVDLFGRDGLKVFDRKFDLIWNQVPG